MRYAIGVDGGATKTHALVVEETGRVLGFGKAGGSNHQSNGIHAAMVEVKRAVQLALETTSNAQKAEFGCFCLAGADLKNDYTKLQKSVEELSLVKSVIVKNDTLAALRSGLSHSWGVVVVCGTGFNAAVRSPEGNEFVLPGLGAISGDWGGGGTLSQEIIRMVMRAWDGRGKLTMLTDLVLGALDLPSTEILLHKLYYQEIDYRRILDLVPLLFEAGEMGDQVAKELIIKMGVEVGVSANALIRKLHLENENVEVVLAGSVFKGKGDLLLGTIEREIQEQAPNAIIVRPKYEPVVGAAFLALEALEITLNKTHYKNLDSTLPQHLFLPANE